MANCKACDAEILFVKSPAGKTMPVDAEPDEDGNVELTLVNGEYRYRVLTKEERETPSLFGGSRHTSHFQTCQFAGNFRRSKQKGEQ